MSKFSLALDSTQIAAFLQCQEYWHLAYQRWLVHKFVRKEAFDRGTVVHGLLERYYLSKINNLSPQDSQQVALKCLDELSDKHKISREDKKLIEQRFILYTCMYLNKDMQPIQVERGFSIPLLDNDMFFFVLEGRIDLIGYLSGIKTWMDHKSQDRDYDLYSHSIQFLNYSFATGLSNGMINYIGLQKVPNESTFRRDALYFSAEKLRRWRVRLITIFYKVTQSLLANNYEKNEAQCQGKWGPCEFSSFCVEETNEAVKEALIQINFMKREPFEPWSLKG